MPTIWKLKNIAPITKMSIESTVATASLATAITMILAITEVISPGLIFSLLGFRSLEAAIIGTFATIAVLFIAAVYFSVAACASYQQMHKNEEISEAKVSAEAAANKAEAAKASAETAANKEVEEKIRDLATKDELNNKADKSELDSKLNADALEGEVKKLLPSLLVDPNVATVDVKKALTNS